MACTPLSASVIIPAHNAAGHVAQCIEACLGQRDLKSPPEIIIVDDGSTDDTEAIAKRYPVKYVHQHNAGPAKARNTGWTVAEGDIVCFTDSDCVPEPDWVAKLLAGYTSDDVGGVGGSYDIANEDSLLAACIHQEIVQRHLEMPESVDYLGSFNLSYRRSVLEEVGGFDDSFRRASGEDNDLAYRVREKGYRLMFERDSRVAHYHPERLWGYLRHQFWHGYWRMKLYRKHPDMAGGDVYSGLSDYAQPPLALAILALAPFSFFWPVGLITCALATVCLALQVPMTMRIVARTGEGKYFVLVPVVFLRSFARGLGMASGFLRFFALSRVGDTYDG